jgi:hypothetical protein
LYSLLGLPPSRYYYYYSLHCLILIVSLGELTIPSKNGFNPKYHALRNTAFAFSRNSNNSPKAVSFHIPWSKTTKDAGATVVGTAQHSSLLALCPFLAISQYAANSNVPSDFSIFGYIDNEGIPQHMVKSTFLAFCDKVWKCAELDHIHGHSFRIGGAVELLLAGVPPKIIAAIGGWTSLAFLLYWRRFEDILPTHVLEAYDSSQISRLKRTLDDFQKANKIPNSLIDACINGLDITDDE